MRELIVHTLDGNIANQNIYNLYLFDKHGNPIKSLADTIPVIKIPQDKKMEGDCVSRIY